MNSNINIRFISTEDYGRSEYLFLPFEEREKDGVRYFVQNDKPERRKLADGTFLSGLKHLDPDDFESVEGFMREHGLAYSCARIEETARLTSHARVDAQLWNDVTSLRAKLGRGNTKFANEAEGIALSDEFAKDIDKIQLEPGVSLVPCVVSFEEASSCLKSAQAVCDILVNACLNPEIGEEGDNAMFAREAGSYLSGVLGKFFKTVVVSIGYVSKAPAVPMVAAIYAQLADSLMNWEKGDVFKTCPKCGRVFQQGHGYQFFGKYGENEEYVERIRSSKYCSERCQKAAKSKRQRDKKRAAKAKAAE